MSDKPFFVGYLTPPPGLRAFLAVICVGMVVGFGAVGWVVGSTQPDPGSGLLYGRQTVTGLLQAQPYPHVHVTEGTDELPVGRTVLLGGGGKTGVDDRAVPLDGQIVTVSGAAVKRGDLDMIQLRGGTRGMSAMMGELPEVEVEDLGRWRLTGEICDGKCYAGAMLPGDGLAHRACANLCLIGGVPPVFVTTAPVEGDDFLLIGGPEGGPITDLLLDYTALMISAEGRIERRGDLLVFLVDPETIEVL